MRRGVSGKFGIGVGRLLSYICQLRHGLSRDLFLTETDDNTSGRFRTRYRLSADSNDTLRTATCAKARPATYED